MNHWIKSVNRYYTTRCHLHLPTAQWGQNIFEFALWFLSSFFNLHKIFNLILNFENGKSLGIIRLKLCKWNESYYSAISERFWPHCVTRSTWWKTNARRGKPRLTERSDLKLGVGAIGVLRATLWFTLFKNVYKVRSN